MSQRSRSIADSLKSLQKRSLPEIPDNDNDFTPVNTSDKSDRLPLKNRVDADSHGSDRNKTEDLINRLSRLHVNKHEDDNSSQKNEDSDTGTHRATSRQRVGRKYDSDDDNESPSHEKPKMRERHRSSYDHSASEESDNESFRGKFKAKSNESDRDRDQDRKTLKPNKYKSEESDDEYSKKRSRSRKHVISSDDEEEHDSRDHKRNERSHRENRYEERSRHDNQEDEDDYRPHQKSSRHREDLNDNSSRFNRELDNSFNTLPKITITRIAKNAGVGRMSADIYETVKELAGKFTHNVLASVSKKSSTGVLTSAELEPVVEKYLGQSAEDLERSEINLSTFAKWFKTLMDQYHVTVKKEAVLYMLNAVEYYIICLLGNAYDSAKHARRSTVTSKDLDMATRM